VDKGGRLTLNSALKEYAGIEDAVQIVGNNNHIELWSPEEWAKETEIFESQSTDTLNINF
jgi:MraZ protein